MNYALSVGTLHEVESGSGGQTGLIFGQASAEKGQPLERPSAAENGAIVVQVYQGGTTSSPDTSLLCACVCLEVASSS